MIRPCTPQERDLVEANMNLVVAVAKRYQGSGDIEDLIQEGRVGLMYAVQRYDEERGIQLSTYASYWIRAYIGKYAMYNRGPVRVGTTAPTRKVYSNLGRLRRKFESIGIQLTPSIIADELGIDLEDVEAMLPRMAGGDVALDAGRDDVRGRPLQLSDTSASPEDIVIENDAARKLSFLVSRSTARLSRRQRHVLRMRFFEGKTLAEIGRDLGVSRERVRQIEAKAMVQFKIRFLRLSQEAA